ncbi:MAG: hypothetical protein AB1696_27115 [Planctomycetota bacterium]
MIEEPPGFFGSVVNLVIATVLGEALVAVFMPGIVAARSWTLWGYPTGCGLIVIAVAVLATVNARAMCGLQRANLESSRALTQGFLLGALVAVGAYCFAELTLLRTRMFEFIYGRHGWTWAGDAIDYAAAPMVLAAMGCVIVGVMFRVRIRTSVLRRVVYSVATGVVLFTVSSAWARLSYYDIYPNHISPLLIDCPVTVAAMAQAVSIFGLFPLSIAIFMARMVRSALR